MSVHRDRCHHRPAVRGTSLAGIRMWRVYCDCGYRNSAALWHTAFVSALIHAGSLK